MKFDFCIGNPPYQEDFENSGDNGNSAKPVYHQFMDAAKGVAEKVELVHPARFLFNAGSTPKEWNQKMLQDKHFKVLHYEPDATIIFPNTDIKGGIAVSYSDSTKDFGAIGIFTAFPELNGIVKKCRAQDEAGSITSIIFHQVRFDLDVLFQDHPECRMMIDSKGKDRRFWSDAFKKINLFSETQIMDDDVKVLGVLKNKRTFRYIPAKYVDMSHENLKLWKTLCPRATGAGVFGEALSPLVIAEPGLGYTQTFIGIGAYSSQFEAEATMKYVKSKFTRTLLGVKKVTQQCPPAVWKMIPLQDFTPSSDIDWSAPIKAIDQQLYRKYGLSDEEIAFIETHVKEMT